MDTLHLPARPPFALHPVIRSHGWIQMAPFSTDPESRSLSYIDRLENGRVATLSIRQSAEGVSVTTDNPLTTPEREEVSRKVQWMLGLNQDFSDFYALARNEPKLAHMEARCQGRVLRCPTFFEDVVKTILTTNTLWAATLRMNRTLIHLYGDPLPVEDPPEEAASGESGPHAFPTPERLAALDETALRADARLGYRAPYVLELARRVASGDLDVEAFKTSDLPTPALRKQLMAIKGIGAYAAAVLLMLLGRYDFLPVDTWALKVVSHEWFDGAPIGPKEVQAAFERWGEWRGMAYWFWDWSYYGKEES